MLSEDEIIDKINYMINNWHRNVVEIDIQWIQGLLDLYNKEKEKNKKLQIRGKELIEEKQELNTALLYDNISKEKIKEKIEYLDNQQRQWLEDRELKDSDAEICFARDFLIKLLKEEN